MRLYTDQDCSVQYADEIGFAFMPCIIKANGKDITSLELIMTSQGSTCKYSVDAFKTGCIMDYREYIQSFFSKDGMGYIDYTLDWDMNNLGLDILFTVKLWAGSELKINFSFTTFYVWGAMKLGETWGGPRRLVWFKHFPFSFGLYTSAATKVLIGYDAPPNKYLDITLAGMFDVMGKVLPEHARYSIIYRYDGEIKQATFDNTFDLTFSLGDGTQEELLRIDYDDSEKGIYLRWIDRHGFYRYWLFTPMEEQRAVSGNGEFLRNNLMAYGDNGYVGAYGRRQGYEREDTVTLCAPSVDSDTFEMLQDLTTSPVVDMYVSGDGSAGTDVWQGVTIKAGTYTKTTQPLQDFSCNLVLNNTNIQKL